MSYLMFCTIKICYYLQQQLLRILACPAFLNVCTYTCLEDSLLKSIHLMCELFPQMYLFCAFMCPSLLDHIEQWVQWSSQYFPVANRPVDFSTWAMVDSSSLLAKLSHVPVLPKSFGLHCWLVIHTPIWKGKKNFDQKHNHYADTCKTLFFDKYLTVWSKWTQLKISP